MFLFLVQGEGNGEHLGAPVPGELKAAPSRLPLSVRCPFLPVAGTVRAGTGEPAPDCPTGVPPPPRSRLLVTCGGVRLSHVVPARGGASACTCSGCRGVNREGQHHFVQRPSILGFPGGSVVKNPPADAGDTGSVPDSGGPHTPRSS